jgi:hypothetical protein
VRYRLSSPRASPCVNGDFRTEFWIRGGSRALLARISSRAPGRYMVVTNPAPHRCRGSNGFQRISVALQTTPEEPRPEEPRQRNGPLGAPKRRPDPPQPVPHPPRHPGSCAAETTALGPGTHWAPRSPVAVDRPPAPTEKVQAGKNGAYRRRKRSCRPAKRPNDFYSQLTLPVIETPPTPHPQPNSSQILIGDSVPKCQRPMRVYGIRATQEIHAGV